MSIVRNSCQPVGALIVSLSLVGLVGCGKEGGFVDSGRPGLVDVGFTPRDGGVGADATVDPDGGDPVDSGPGRDGGFPDLGPQPDSGTPGATFNEVTVDDTIVHGQGVELVDIDGDNDLDIVSSLSLTDAVHLYLNDGTASSFTRVVVGTNIVAMETAAADVDGDNDLDLIAVGLFDRNVGFSSAGEITWFENPGNPQGTWTRQAITGLTFWGPLFVEAADLTGDNRPDLVVGGITMTDNGGNVQGNGVHLLVNTGGGFAAPVALDADLIDVFAVTLADVDGDGPIDVLAVGGGSNQVAWWRNGRTGPDQNPTFTKHVIATPSVPTDMQLANMDGDADLELVLSMTRGNGAVVYYDPPADRTATWTEVMISEEAGFGRSTRIYAADLDGDQRTDVAVGAAEITRIEVLFQGEGGSFTSRLLRNDYTGLNWLSGGDMNGDNRPDFVTATYERAAGQDTLSWWTNTPE